MKKQRETILTNVVSDVYKEFQKRLRKNQALDFDDLIMHDDSTISACSGST